MVHVVVVDPHREGVWAGDFDLLVPRQRFLHPEESRHGSLILPRVAVDGVYHLRAVSFQRGRLSVTSGFPNIIGSRVRENGIRLTLISQCNWHFWVTYYS